MSRSDFSRPLIKMGKARSVNSFGQFSDQRVIPLVSELTAGYCFQCPEMFFSNYFSNLFVDVGCHSSLLFGTPSPSYAKALNGVILYVLQVKVVL